MSLPRKVVIVGQGYVGLPLAMRAVEVGYQVVGFDKDPYRVERLSSANSYVEDVSSAQLSSALASGRYLPTTDPTDVGSFGVALITVPTPLREGGPDLTFVLEAGRALAEHLKPGALVVLESTSYPGTTEELLSDLLRRNAVFEQARIFTSGTALSASTPATRTFAWRRSPRSSPASSAASLAAVQAFYDTMVHKTIAVSRPREAELAKLIREHLPPCQHRLGERARHVCRRCRG